MRKSLLSLKDLDNPDSQKPRNDFLNLPRPTLLSLRQQALAENNLEDYLSMTIALITTHSTIEEEQLNEFLDVLFKRREFEKLRRFFQECRGRVETGEKTFVQFKLRFIILAVGTIEGWEEGCFGKYKRLRSYTLYNNYIRLEEKVRKEVEEMINTFDSFVQNGLYKNKRGDCQFEINGNGGKVNSSYLDSEAVRQSAFGDTHCLFLAAKGFVLGLGSNTKKQLLPLCSKEKINQACYLPSINKESKFLRARKIFARFNTSIVVGVSGELVIWGENWPKGYTVITDLPNTENVVILKTEIVIMDVDLDSIFSIKTAKLQSFLNTQQHRNNPLTVETSFTDLTKEEFVEKVETNIKEKVRMVATGNNHFLVLTFNNKVLGFGNNEKKQLCFSNKKRFSSIEQLNNAMDIQISTIFAARDFSLIVDKEGVCSIFGAITRNSYIKRDQPLSKGNLHSGETTNHHKTQFRR